MTPKPKTKRRKGKAKEKLAGVVPSKIALPAVASKPASIAEAVAKQTFEDLIAMGLVGRTNAKPREQ